MPYSDPLGRIEDILNAIARIQRYTIGLTFDTFDDSELVVDAVVRNFITIAGSTVESAP